MISRNFAGLREMSKFVEYLKIFRAHTSPITVLTLVIYYYLGGGELFSWMTPALILLGIYLHWCGFGHNSVMDYHYDLNDPNKQHFPLVKGTIHIDEARKIINSMMLLGIFVTSLFALFFAKNPVMALFCLALYVQAGHSYNDGMDKVTVWKWFPEAICYMFLAGYAFFFGSSDISELFWLGLLYLFLVVMYEIYWEGELKEIEFMGEVNILRYFGARLEDNSVLIIPRWLQATSYLINIAKLLVGYMIVWLVAGLVGVAIYSAGAVIVMYYVYKLTKSPRLYIHDKELEYMGNAEALGLVFFTIAVMSGSFKSLAFSIGLALFSLVWYRVFNKIQWGVSKRPQV